MIEASAVADRLRTLADWLDAHPGAVVSHVDVDDGPVLKVTSFAAKTPEEMSGLSAALDPGNWGFVSGGHAYTMAKDIGPGLRFEFFLSKAKAETVAA